MLDRSDGLHTHGRTGVVKTINPSLRVGLSAMNGADIVRLAKVVPSADLDEIIHVAVLENAVPTSRVEVRTGIVNPLQ